MKHPVVLDACTIINLLRIDEDEFLFRLLCSLRLYVADLVNQEIMKNIFHNELSEEQRTYISGVLPQLQSKWNSFNQTMDLIDTDFYETYEENKWRTSIVYIVIIFEPEISFKSLFLY
mgnify:CR=1 FL=1